MKDLILIDAHSIIYRAYYALPPLTSPNGEVANAVYGFAAVFLKIINQKQPKYLAAAFDVAVPTFREKEFEDYKAQRKKMPDDLASQIPVIEKMLDVFNVPVYKQERFEADDIIGTIAQKTSNESGIKITIVSGDLDVLQLVDKITEVCVPQKGVKETIIYNQAKVFDKYHLLPSQIADLKGLKGDASDNIPGVPGIGEKIAVDLLKEFGNLEKIYENLGDSDISSRIKSKLLEYKDQAFLSRHLATIEKQAPINFNLNDCQWHNFNKEEAIKFFKELGFSTLIERLP